MGKRFVEGGVVLVMSLVRGVRVSIEKTKGGEGKG